MSIKTEPFDNDIVQSIISRWVSLATDYQKQSERQYAKLRSYLTVYQFRLSDSEKTQLRDMLSRKLDIIDNENYVENMDSFLDGFCFKLDSDIIPKLKKAKHSVTTDKTPSRSTFQHTDHTTDQDEKMEVETNSYNHANNTLEEDALDFYSMQFM